MRLSIRLGLAVPALALGLALGPIRDAAACGGCFHVPMDNTQVTYHRMIFSVSPTQSTLYDEIKYAGTPSSFAWVLPIKGMVTVGTSSDALFAELDNLTAVQVIPPPYPCPPCPTTSTTSGSSSGAGGGLGLDGGGVTVISQAVVGPYETVQLSSSDPTALTTWLMMHGYAIPADVATIISAYITDGFDFLAVKLVPGTSVSAMQPLRVTTPGASVSLPLRMVAAGVGATIPITLFVVGDGRYDPTNFPTFTTDASKLVWDWSTGMSNLATLTQQGIAATNGKGWLIESAQPTSEAQITNTMINSATQFPMQSGYADSMGMNAVANATADMAALFNGVDQASLWITRLHAELPRTDLDADLTVGAAAMQTQIPNYLQAAKGINPPVCSCGGTGGAGGAGGASSGTSSSGGTGGQGGAQGGTTSSLGGGCGVARDDRSTLPFIALLGALLLRRRRRAMERRP